MLRLLNRKSGQRDINLLTLLRLLLHLKEEKRSRRARSHNFFAMAMGCTGGFSAVYLWCYRLSEGLEEMGQSLHERLPQQVHYQPLCGSVEGAVATTFLESSSVTIIMVITMVVLGLTCAVIGGCLGSNIVVQ